MPDQARGLLQLGLGDPAGRFDDIWRVFPAQGRVVTEDRAAGDGAIGKDDTKFALQRQFSARCIIPTRSRIVADRPSALRTPGEVSPRAAARNQVDRKSVV